MNETARTELGEIHELAEQIYAKATTLNKKERHAISDAAKLISWICFQHSNPTDAEAIAAIAKLKAAISAQVIA